MGYAIPTWLLELFKISDLVTTEAHLYLRVLSCMAAASKCRTGMPAAFFPLHGSPKDLLQLYLLAQLNSTGCWRHLSSMGTMEERWPELGAGHLPREKHRWAYGYTSNVGWAGLGGRVLGSAGTIAGYVQKIQGWHLVWLTETHSNYPREEAFQVTHLQLAHILYLTVGQSTVKIPLRMWISALICT